MSYHILVRPEVVDDLDEIESWYEKKQRGLGSSFMTKTKVRLIVDTQSLPLVVFLFTSA